jgi:hypothetical protein
VPWRLIVSTVVAIALVVSDPSGPTAAVVLRLVLGV